MKLSDLTNASESTKRRNAELFSGNLGAISNPQRKHDPSPALARGNKRVKSSGTGLAFRVSIISVRQRIMDQDNLIAGSKWLRDHIAETIGIDDAEGAGIEFEYGQILTKGEEGTLVRIVSLT